MFCSGNFLEHLRKLRFITKITSMVQLPCTSPPIPFGQHIKVGSVRDVSFTYLRILFQHKKNTSLSDGKFSDGRICLMKNTPKGTFTKMIIWSSNIFILPCFCQNFERKTIALLATFHISVFIKIILVMAEIQTRSNAYFDYFVHGSIITDN